ncbi:Ureidoglycolate hydrolase [Thioclava sp. SK-1]|uniref:ureidoglycolate lyase n=1 Tax=Thioclava sp. SK-1 TaxID=1889770 RepID=UPI0008244DBA|nr:ureidoglycolate lyase [Thioclava sp. SK-1]OCX63117.1 Ureidoglycolate hydrolase [Thioclava sp. SK-1]
MDITASPLTATAFAPFGDVLEVRGDPDKIINQGKCGRFHDLAQLSAQDGRLGISLFKADARSLPYSCTLLERHPNGSQAFIPMSNDPFLIIVAPDSANTPGTPQAFLTNGHQAINFHRNIWHGVLTPLADPGLFAVVDRIGAGPNLEEYPIAPVHIHA